MCDWRRLEGLSADAEVGLGRVDSRNDALYLSVSDWRGSGEPYRGVVPAVAMTIKLVGIW